MSKINGANETKELAASKRKGKQNATRERMLEPSGTLEGSTEVELDVNQLIPNPHQPRESTTPDEGLKSTMHQFGLLNAVTVMANDDGETYTIVAGHRRWQAAKEMGLKKIRCYVRPNTTLDDAQALVVIENVKRENLDPRQIRRAVISRKRSRPDLSWEQIAKEFGFSPARIAHFKMIDAQPNRVQELLDEKKIDQNVVYAVAKIKDEKAKVKMAEIAAEQNMSAEDVRAVIEESPKISKTAARKKIKKGRAEEKKGERETGSPGSVDHIIELAEKTAKALRNIAGQRISEEEATRTMAAAMMLREAADSFIKRAAPGE